MDKTREKQTCNKGKAIKQKEQKKIFLLFDYEYLFHSKLYSVSII